jgi:xylulokinase
MGKTADILLGIDIGTTALKAGLFNAHSGEALSTAADQLPVEAAADGQREQQPAELLARLRRVTRQLQDDVGSAWQRVAGIGLASQGGSAILCDHQTGEALTPMQLWNDTRPLHLLGDIAGRRPEGYWRQLTRLSEPGAGLARIVWLRQLYPHLIPDGRTTRPMTLYAGAGEYVYFALTRSWRQDAGNALQIGCYSVTERALDADPLAAVGVPLAFVAPLRRGHEPPPLSEHGSRLLGLPASIPVSGPYMDHEAGYLSAVEVDAQQNDKSPKESVRKLPLQCSLGTAWVGNFVSDAVQPPAYGVDLVLPSPVNAASLILRVMTAGNLTWDWGLDNLLGGPRAAALEQAEAIFTENVLPPDGLISFPWFTQPNSWNAKLPGNGGFLGLNAQTSPADMLRALAAGITFEFASLFPNLSGDTNVVPAGGGAALYSPVNCVILGGGASKGIGFQQLLAALFAPLPVYVALDQDMIGARGSVYAFSKRASHCAVRSISVPHPSLCARIAQQYQHYLTVRNAIGPRNEDFH